MLGTSGTVSGLFVIFLIASTISQEEVPRLKFSCQGRATGYYADIDSGCQIYHMCDGLGRQFSYSCPNTTLFQQRMLICDHWYMVNCSTAEIDYTANLLIGSKKPFVEDSDKQYQRTPRPDLLTEPTASEINLIYRTGRAQNQSKFNLVGVNSDFDQNNGSSAITDKPAYRPPSHWSTEYVSSTPPTSVNIQRENGENPLAILLLQQRNKDNTVEPSIATPKEVRRNERIDIVAAKSINFNTLNLDNVIRTKPINSFPKKETVVNFKSQFKATTPVFPTQEELVTTESPLDDILNPPVSPNVNGRLNDVDFETETAKVNFDSLFKATTPVFPTKEQLGTTEASVDDILNPPRNKELDESAHKENVIVNFNSLFEATTPVFPTKEELGTTEASVDDLLIPPRTKESDESASKENVIINFGSLFQATTPVYPSKEELGTTEAPVDDILQPPSLENEKLLQRADIDIDQAPVPISNVKTPSLLFEPPKLDYTVKTDSSKNVKSKSKTTPRLSSEKVLKELKKMFSIPDYEFPLDTMTRPGYDQSFDSFDANPFLADIIPRQHAS